MQLPQASIVAAVVILGAAAYAFTRDPPAAPPAPRAGETPAADEMQDEPRDPSPEDEDEPAEAPGDIVWTAPATWPEAPNPSTMRLATHRVPHVAGDTEDAELSVARAGGDPESNIARWKGQFTQGSAPRRVDRTVAGLRVTVVAMDGTFEGGMGAGSAPHPGWAMIAAIVELPSLDYFFKVTGPARTVRAAVPAFEAMIDGLRPAKP